MCKRDKDELKKIIFCDLVSPLLSVKKKIKYLCFMISWVWSPCEDQIQRLYCCSSRRPVVNSLHLFTSQLHFLTSSWLADLFSPRLPTPVFNLAQSGFQPCTEIPRGLKWEKRGKICVKKYTEIPFGWHKAQSCCHSLCDMTEIGWWACLERCIHTVHVSGILVDKSCCSENNSNNSQGVLWKWRDSFQPAGKYYSLLSTPVGHVVWPIITDRQLLWH